MRMSVIRPRRYKQPPFFGYNSPLIGGCAFREVRGSAAVWGPAHARHKLPTRPEMKAQTNARRWQKTLEVVCFTLLVAICAQDFPAFSHRATNKASLLLQTTPR